MTSTIYDSQQLRRILVRRFIVSLALAAMVSVGSLWVVFVQLQDYRYDAQLVNLSGRQRMFTQRISLLVAQLHLATDPVETESLRNVLTTAIAEMRVAQERLNRNPIAPSPKYPHPNMTGEAKQKVDEFLDTVAILVSSSGQHVASPSLHELLELEENLLVILERNVNARVAHYGYKMQQFVTIECALMGFALLVLVGKLFLVFKPTITLVSSNLGSLERAYSEMIEFAYRISHDLKAPIVSSAGIVELARDAFDEDDYETAEKSLEHVQQSLTRVSSTIEDIVGLVRQRITKIEPEIFQVSAAINEAVENIKHMPEFKGVTLNVHCPHDDQILAKRFYVKQSLENLISNAVKYHDPQEATPEIQVDVEIKKQSCCVRVSDNGLGIKTDNQSQIFQMFQRFHPKVSFGTGLGLYLVQQNAAALQGHIDYQPRPKGSQFTLSFPTQEVCS